MIAILQWNEFRNLLQKAWYTWSWKFGPITTWFWKEHLRSMMILVLRSFQLNEAFSLKYSEIHLSDSPCGLILFWCPGYLAQIQYYLMEKVPWNLQKSKAGLTLSCDLIFPLTTNQEITEIADIQDNFVPVWKIQVSGVHDGNAASHSANISQGTESWDSSWSKDLWYIFLLLLRCYSRYTVSNWGCMVSGKPPSDVKVPLSQCSSGERVYWLEYWIWTVVCEFLHLTRCIMKCVFSCFFEQWSLCHFDCGPASSLLELFFWAVSKLLQWNPSRKAFYSSRDEDTIWEQRQWLHPWWRSLVTDSSDWIFSCHSWVDQVES